MLIKFKQAILKFFIVQWFIVRVLPKIRFNFQPPKMTSSMFYEFQKALRPGDLIFSSDRSKLSSWLIPGRWDHVAVVSNLTNEFGVPLIVEAHQPVVRWVTPFQFCHDSDFVGVGRPTDPKLATRFAEECRKFVGIPYDSLFAKGREALYCSEIIWEMDADNELGFDDTDARGLGVPYLSPDGLACSQHLDWVVGVRQ